MASTKELVEIRWHGRGGQGAVTSAEMVAQAAIGENRYGQAFPSFGPERRGAPVQSFLRVSTDKPIRIRAAIDEPDAVVVLDPGVLRIMDVTSGLKKGGFVIINSRKTADELRRDFGFDYPLAVVNANVIAREELGILITNTTMVGALLKATGVVVLESVIAPLEARFGRLAEKNIKAMKRAYAETVVEETSN
ncbi:MAG: 2-oxoacid:acceptor oxidoreductase family protein [Planctomycetota bacterium]|nr:2-oxoacid:acceptor oxidoreductase family protein [Planctomycetota bacterium]